jgi:hypothetical protein
VETGINIYVEINGTVIYQQFHKKHFISTGEVKLQSVKSKPLSTLFKFVSTFLFRQRFLNIARITREDFLKVRNQC